MVFPPQGAGGIADAGALADSYVELFKEKDVRGIVILPYAEYFYNAGKITVDDVAAFINDVIDDIAFIALHFEIFYTPPFAASILNSSGLSVSKASAIINDENLSLPKAVAIMNDESLLISRAAAIMNDENLSAFKAAAIIDDENLSTSKAYNIITHDNLSANRTQEILYSMSISSKLVDILTYDAGDLTVSSNTTISGVNRYNTLTINSGVTLTIDGQPGALIVKTLNNSGTIVKSATGGTGGNPAAYGAGRGGNGGGGLIIFADYVINTVIRANGDNGTSGSGTGLSGGWGGHGGDGHYFRVGSDSAGNGGAGGSDTNGSAGGGGGNGGSGGDGYSSYNGGNGGSVTYTTFSTYQSLAEHIKKSVIDWVLVNVFKITYQYNINSKYLWCWWRRSFK
jgi:hypothetical protein